MEEINEEQQTAGFDFQRYTEIARRRHLQFLVPLFLGWLVIWGVSWVLPSRYKSSTLILVEQPTMPKNYVVPNVTDDLQNRMQSITQQILSRTRLLIIIDKLHLYSGGRRPLTPDEQAEKMRTDIEIELVRSSQGDQISAFRIFYTSSDPHIAQKVTSELTNLFISENLKVRQQRSEDTTKFIGDQLEIARDNLAEQEAKVREFKGLHEGELPSQEASNLQILSGLQAQLQNEQDSLNGARQQRVYLQTLIEQNHAIHATTRTADGAPTGLPAIDQTLARLNARLVDLSSRYTDHYPEVEAVKEEIAKTEKIRAGLVADLTVQNERAKHGVAPKSDEVVDPTQTAATLQLQSQLQANQAEVANREQTVAALKARINAYQDRLNNVPVREQEIADLTRGYDQSKANYDDLLKKQTDSEMATSMEQMQQGERFSTLDPPSLPVKPAFPDRLKFCGIGLFAGAALGLLLVGILEFLDDRMHSEKDLKDLLSMAIIAEVPEILESSDEQKEKRRIAFGWAVAGIVAAIILTGSAISYLRG